MRSARIGLPLVAFGCLWLAADVSAQQATIATPLHSINEGFYEHIGTNWSLQGKGWNFRFGAPNLAAPQFGGFDPSAGANVGFGIKGPGVSGNFNANFSQGFRQSFVTQTPSVTLPNGGTGFVSDTSQSPFVMGYIPVVGGFPGFGPVMPMAPPMYSVPPPEAAINPGPSAVQEALQRARGAKANQGRIPDPRVDDILLPAKPAAPPKARVKDKEEDLVLAGPAGGKAGAGAGDQLTRAQASSAGRAAPSVEEARRLHAAEQTSHDSEAMKYVAMARSAEESGKANVAKIYYQMAARRATGELKDQIVNRLNTLKPQPAQPKEE